MPLLSLKVIMQKLALHCHEFDCRGRSAAGCHAGVAKRDQLAIGQLQFAQSHLQVMRVDEHEVEMAHQRWGQQGPHGGSPAEGCHAGGAA